MYGSSSIKLGVFLTLQLFIFLVLTVLFTLCPKVCCAGPLQHPAKARRQHLVDTVFVDKCVWMDRLLWAFLTIQHAPGVPVPPKADE